MEPFTKKGDATHLETASDGSVAQLDVDELNSIEKTKTGKFPWLVSVTAAIGGSLFGYDTGINAAVLVTIHNSLGHHLSSSERELITSITSGGAFFGAIMAGLTADRYGRKPAIYGGCLLFTIGAIVQAASFSVAQMTIGRLIFPNGTEEQVAQKVQHITAHVEMAKNLNRGKSRWWVLKQLYVVPANFRALVAACGLMAISQLGGFNALMYYSPVLFSLVGFSNPVAVGTVIAGTNFLFTWVNLMLVDRAGRRRILLCTVPFMGLWLLVAAICFIWIPIEHDLTLAAGSKIGAPAIMVLVSMVFYVGFYSSGIGNTAWLSSEFFPMEVRAMGTMMLTMTCWGSNVIVASTFLTQMENTTPSGAFGFYAAICTLGSVCIYLCYPEVKGMTLEDIREVFQHGFGVQKARELQKEMKLKRKTEASSGSP